MRITDEAQVKGAIRLGLNACGGRPRQGVNFKVNVPETRGGKRSWVKNPSNDPLPRAPLHTPVPPRIFKFAQTSAIVILSSQTASPS
jgi:hypothetical protein